MAARQVSSFHKDVLIGHDCESCGCYKKGMRSSCTASFSSDDLPDKVWNCWRPVGTLLVWKERQDERSE